MMQAYTLIKQDKQNYIVEGEITLSTLNKTTLKSFAFLQSAKEINIDLAKVTTVDSAGLALMIEWIKHSKHYDTKLTFTNIPQQIMTLATLCGFENNEYITDINPTLNPTKG